MEKINKILERLGHWRQSGRDRWIAKCPSHDDSSPSLSLALARDGRILIHCHAGCGANEVLGSLGLEYGDLFPDGDNYAPLFRKPQKDITDALIVEIAKSNIDRGVRLSETDKQAVIKAKLRLAAHG